MANSEIILNTEKLNSLFDQLKGRLSDLKPLMTEIAGIMYYAVQENFRTQGARLPGDGWKQLKHNSGNHDLLQDSGMLVNSISYEATETEAIVGTNYKSAALHQFGGIIKAKKILGSVKRKKDVYAMEQFFWRKWYASGKEDNYYKGLALLIHKKGELTVPARPFLVLIDSDYKKMDDAVISFLNS